MGKTVKMLMTDTFEVKGRWFLPESDLEADGVNGVLRYSPKEIVLDLIGSFDNLFSSSNYENESRTTILGFSEDGEWFTLLKCIPRSIRMLSSGFNTCSYSTNRFYVGTQLIKSEETELFNSADFSFANLNAWMGFPVIKYDLGNANRKFGCMIDLGASRDVEKKIEIASIKSILSEEYNCWIKYPHDYFLQEAAQVVVNRFYRLVPSREQLVSAQSMLINIHLLRRLLTLMSGSGMYITYVDFNLQSKGESFSAQKTLLEDNHCRIFFKQVGDICAAKHLSPHDPGAMLLTRNDIIDNLEQIINYWFSKQDQLGECVNAYISDLYLFGYMENHFLNIIRGIESYHRFFVENQIVDEASDLFSETEIAKDRQKILNYIGTEISDKNKNYFLQRINYVDEMSLRRRIKDLFKLAPAILISKLFGNLSSSKQSRIISTIIDTRNYYTHRSEKKNYQNALEAGVELMRLTNQLSILLQYFCLTQLGVDSNMITQHLIISANQLGL